MAEMRVRESRASPFQLNKLIILYCPLFGFIIKYILLLRNWDWVIVKLSENEIKLFFDGELFIMF